MLKKDGVKTVEILLIDYYKEDQLKDWVILELKN